MIRNPNSDCSAIAAHSPYATIKRYGLQRVIDSKKELVDALNEQGLAEIDRIDQDLAQVIFDQITEKA